MFWFYSHIFRLGIGFVLMVLNSYARKRSCARLPNHPCYIDPPTVLSHLHRAVKVPLRPLVYSGTYRVPFLLPLMKLVRAFGCLTFQQSQSAVAQAQHLIAVVEGIDQGNSFIIYPSGRLQRTHLEKIGSAAWFTR